MNLFFLWATAGVAIPVLVAACSAIDVVDATGPEREAELPRPRPAVERVSDPLLREERVCLSGAGVSMEVLVRKALGWHPTINEAAARVREAQEKIVEAKAGYLPGVSGGVRSTYSNDSDGSL